MTTQRWTCVIVAAALAACAPDSAPDANEPPVLSETEQQSFAAMGEETAGDLAQTLIGRLQSALAEQGAVGAVEFCSIEAAPLTARVTQRGMTVKRTSFRFRNPDNAPDDLEEDALRHFEGSSPGSAAGWVQVASPAEVRYYKPLYVQDFCLQCHGSAADLAEGIPEVLRERYPDDRATGYASGDFRGVIRVSMPRTDPDPGR